MSKTYRVNEVFYSLQGEGVRAGTPNVFIRFSGCNMRCSVEPGEKSPGGFDCDTEFESGRSVTLDELRLWVTDAVKIACGRDEPLVDIREPVDISRWLILTGGEPGLQVDRDFIDYWHKAGWKMAVETNGSIELPNKWQTENPGTGESVLDWITVSPKVAEHAIKQLYADEVKYVRGYGQGIPKTVVQAEHYLISPAFDAMRCDPKTMEWCVRLCLENPKWRLSIQQHKQMKVR